MTGRVLLSLNSLGAFLVMDLCGLLQEERLLLGRATFGTAFAWCWNLLIEKLLRFIIIVRHNNLL